MPKARKHAAGKAARHNPLADQIMEEEESKGLRKNPRTKEKRAKDDDDEEEALPAGMTRKVMQVAQAQKASEDFADGDQDDENLIDDAGGALTDGAGSCAGDLDMSDVEMDQEGNVLINEGATEEEKRALALFLPPERKGPAQGLNLADLILQKIQDHEAKKDRQEAHQDSAASFGLSPKVIKVYADIGVWLARYKMGKIPKAFKVIPSLTNWEEVLALTKPLNWSPAAMYEAVAIFASNLNPRMAQRFYNLVLLPAIRQNIQSYGKLNFHYYRSLRKTIFKPAAFFKGIVLPLATDNCTLNEASLICSVLAKTSIPVMHASAAIVRLCTMSPWYGTTSIILACLLNKKYALPLQVIEHVVAHFYAFTPDERALPVVWHRSFLVFVQRYKFELNEDQKKRIREVVKVHWHESIGIEVRRELLAPKPGEFGMEGAMPMDD